MKIKNILTGLLLLSGFSSFARGYDDVSIVPGSITIIAGTAFPNYLKFLPEFSGKSVGPFQLGAQYQIGEKFSLGLQYSYCKASTAMYEETDNLGNSFSYKFDVSLNTIFVNGDYYWFDINRIALYSGLGFGYAQVKAAVSFSDNASHSGDFSYSGLASTFGWQLRLIGVKANIVKGLGAYADLGFGWNGILEVGLKYTFGGKDVY